MLDESRVRKLLQPFGFDPSPYQVKQIIAYLDLLLRWTEKINLTAIRDPEECVTRHFGESLYVAQHVSIYGRLLDIGSGGGFPGLALKLAFPEVGITLLEPVAKKRAFLKEASRACDLSGITVSGVRLEELGASQPAELFDFASMRAVGDVDRLAPLAAAHLKLGGSLLLWSTRPSTDSFRSGLTWQDALPIPLSRSGKIWRGVKPRA